MYINNNQIIFYIWNSVLLCLLSLIWCLFIFFSLILFILFLTFVRIIGLRPSIIVMFIIVSIFLSGSFESLCIYFFFCFSFFLFLSEYLLFSPNSFLLIFSSILWIWIDLKWCPQPKLQVFVGKLFILTLFLLVRDWIWGDSRVIFNGHSYILRDWVQFKRSNPFLSIPEILNEFRPNSFYIFLLIIYVHDPDSIDTEVFIQHLSSNLYFVWFRLSNFLNAQDFLRWNKHDDYLHFIEKHADSNVIVSWI